MFREKFSLNDYNIFSNIPGVLETYLNDYYNLVDIVYYCEIITF